MMITDEDVIHNFKDDLNVGTKKEELYDDAVITVSDIPNCDSSPITNVQINILSKLRNEDESLNEARVLEHVISLDSNFSEKTNILDNIEDISSYNDFYKDKYTRTNSDDQQFDTVSSLSWSMQEQDHVSNI